MTSGSGTSTGPIFIVGSQRSGSTLLRVIVDSHQHIAIPEETNFMQAIEATHRIRGWVDGDEWYRRLGATRAEMDEKLRDLYSSLFERYAHEQGKRRWGDKSPSHVYRVRMLSEMFPTSLIIGIVRHPAPAVLSLTKSFTYPRRFWQAARYWYDANSTVLQAGANLPPDRFAIVRYEDIVANAARTLPAVFAWLGEPWSDELLNFQRIQQERGNTAPSDGGTRPDQPLDPARATIDADVLDRSQWRYLEGVTGHMARFLGYRDLRDPLALDPFPDSAEAEPPLLGGDALRQMAKTELGAQVVCPGVPVGPRVPRLVVSKMRRRWRNVRRAARSPMDP